MKKIALTLYSKPECSLCEPFSTVIKSVLSKSEWAGVECKTINILENKTAFEKFHDKIPVLTINGDLAFKYLVTEKELEEKINKLV
jgi:hypothetical protein